MRLHARIAAIAATGSIGAALVLVGAGPAIARPAVTAPPAVNTVVYSETNAVAGNAIQVFTGGKLGRLSPGGSFAAGGLGTGVGIHSQGSVALARDDRSLLAVDAGSNQISDFVVGPDGTLLLTGVVSSGGTEPISIAVSQDRVVVLNAGGTPNLAGFKLTARTLVPDPGLNASLSAGANTPEQVGFSPNGAWVVVTEKVSGTIDVYKVRGGRLIGPVTTPSNAPTPYGFAFAPTGQLVVSDAGGGVADASATSIYTINSRGFLEATQPAVGDGQSAACWLEIAAGHVLVANAGSSSISDYRLTTGGVLSFVENTMIGGGPLDEAVVGRFAYVVVPSLGQIEELLLSPHGVSYPAQPNRGLGLPSSVGGLAAG